VNSVVQRLWHVLPTPTRSRVYRTMYRLAPKATNSLAERFAGTSRARVPEPSSADSVNGADGLAEITRLRDDLRHIATQVEGHTLGLYQLLEAAFLRTDEEIALIRKSLENITSRLNSADSLLRDAQRTAETMDRRAADRTVHFARAIQGHLDHLVGLYAAIRPRAPLGRFGAWRLEPDAAEALYNLVIDLTPEMVVEAGSGLSTVVISAGLVQNGEGELLALEHGEAFADATRHELERQGVASVGEVLLSPLRPHSTPIGDLLWYDTTELFSRIGERRIDLLLIDGPPASVGTLARYPALPVLAPLLAPGACIIVDDAGRPDEEEALRRWVEQWPGIQVEHLELARPVAVLRWPGLGAVDEEASF
jgi:predicted O-methyltransferase YrrM